MTILEYLQKKYSVARPTTITRAEAKGFGIPYPLTSGWLTKHGSREARFTKSLVKKMQVRAHKQAKHSKLRVRNASKYAVNAVALICEMEVGKNEKSAPRIRRAGKFTNNFIVSDAFLQTYEWRATRMQVLKRDGAICACCGASPANGAIMNVDHIKPRRLFPHLALDISNLQVLCGDCNHGKGNWDQTDWRPKDCASIESNAAADEAFHRNVC